MQGESSKQFPFQKHAQIRPSSLPLPVSTLRNKTDNTVSTEVQQFATNLVDGVIKTVSETRADCLGQNTTEITVTDTDKKQSTENENT